MSISDEQARAFFGIEEPAPADPETEPDQPPAGVHLDLTGMQQGSASRDLDAEVFFGIRQ